MVGLLHDFDYEMFPARTSTRSRARTSVRARLSGSFHPRHHGTRHLHGVPRDTPLARALFATDELCGFLVACALVRPSKESGRHGSVVRQKKLKDKAFARTVNREDIIRASPSWASRSTSTSASV
jgi:predicted hydrolase (HD superfamily)